jgi:homoserine acetyltransferase
MCRLLDIVHADQKLYLVFEFLDVDLKRYMEAGNSQGTPLSLELCQVRKPHTIKSMTPLATPFRLLSDNFHFFPSAADSTP